MVTARLVVAARLWRRSCSWSVSVGLPAADAKKADGASEVTRRTPSPPSFMVDLLEATGDQKDPDYRSHGCLFAESHRTLRGSDDWRTENSAACAASLER